MQKILTFYLHVTALIQSKSHEESQEARDAYLLIELQGAHKRSAKNIKPAVLTRVEV